MVAARISVNSPTKAIFVEPGAKINADYYINNVLKQYFKETERLYPNDNFVFHQDSAPSHSAKKALNFLQDKKINFRKPRQWMPNSPDWAPCDYFLWGYLKRALKCALFKVLKVYFLRAKEKSSNIHQPRTKVLAKKM
jgi:hypothetical protein